MMKNNYSSQDGYFNGDIGIVKELGKGKMVADIRGEMVNLCRDALDDVQLAYGMTIHKSQGSEFKNAIVVMPSEPANSGHRAGHHIKYNMDNKAVRKR